MATIYQLNSQNPQGRSIDLITEELKKGAIMLYPTDTVYAIGCDLNSKSAVARVRQIKQLSSDKPLTFLCSSLSHISEYAIVNDQAYRIMKRLIPGPYTFLLPTTKLVPKLVMSPKRKTTGIRVPDNQICHALLESLNNPIISTSAHLSDEEEEFSPHEWEKFKLFDHLEKQVDIIIDDDTNPSVNVSTILDFTSAEPTVIRKGLGWEKLEDWIGFSNV